jgi:oligoribonuclease
MPQLINTVLLLNNLHQQGAPVSYNTENLIWIDLEMTGLDVSQDRIIEMATIVTDSQLNVVAEGPVFAIYQPDDVLAKMDDWNVTHHTRSGLVARVKASTVTETQAEAETLAFLQQYAPVGESPMCGNSVWQDRRFLSRYMPALEKYFHYRLIDVSTLKELAKRWAPKIYGGIRKESQHLALADIRESIDELKYYRTHYLRTD